MGEGVEQVPGRLLAVMLLPLIQASLGILHLLLNRLFRLPVGLESLIASEKKAGEVFRQLLKGPHQVLRIILHGDENLPLASRVRYPKHRLVQALVAKEQAERGTSTVNI